MMKRHMARELAVQSLFQMELSDLTAQEAIEFAVEGKEYDTFVEQLVNGVETNKATIDQHIREALVNWSFERLGNIERTILRLLQTAFRFEIRLHPTPPPRGLPCRLQYRLQQSKEWR